MEQFLSKWEWVEQGPEDIEQGMTWLELAIAFELHTHTALPTNRSLLAGVEGQLASKPGIAAKARAMQCAARQTLKTSYSSNCWKIADAGRSKEQLRGSHRSTILMKLGITGVWSTMASWPLLDEHLMTDVTIALLRQRGERKDDLASKLQEDKVIQIQALAK